MPDAEDFRALARSSPWRFTTLRFSHRSGRSAQSVRAWLRRPDALRVEDASGALLDVVHGRSSVGVVLGAEPLPAPAPVFRPDGLVAVRPAWGDASQADDPMWQDYRWVAVLDPLELADGRDPETGDPTGGALRIDAVREVEHGGRPAWEAVVATTPTYEPRCGCCPLLRDPDSDRREWGSAFDGVEYPSASLVRLDVGTGVCVSSEVLDGTYAGDGHEIGIEAVDEPMDDDLFVDPPRPPGDGWSPFPRPGRR